MLVINEQQASELLDLEALIDALAPAMSELSAGNVSQPPRIAAMVEEKKGLLAAMPVYLPNSKALACKLVSVFPLNHALGLVSHQAAISLFDGDTGRQIALIDGTHITAERTAAGAALATRLLARPDATKLAILGTGVQASAHIGAIPRVRDIKEIRIAGRSRDKAAALAERVKGEATAEIVVADSFEDAVRGAEIICGTTDAAEPIMEMAWVPPGAHINSVGFNLKGREIGEDVVAGSKVFVEARFVALAEPPAGANDLMWPIRDDVITKDHILAEIGELVSGDQLGRAADNDITLYKSVGLGVQDAAAAELVYRAALNKNIGVEVDF